MGGQVYRMHELTYASDLIKCGHPITDNGLRPIMPESRPNPRNRLFELSFRRRKSLPLYGESQFDILAERLFVQLSRGDKI